MHQKKAEVVDSFQIVTFKIGNEEYGIDILKVQEIQKVPKVLKLPFSQDHILGVIDLRGKVIPVVDLGKKFGIIADVSKSNRIVVVDVNGKKIGLAIDAVSNVLRVDSNSIDPPPPVVKGISSKYVVGIAKQKSGFIVVLDINQIFSAEELEEIESTHKNQRL
jgi:purine-binding chemotaxis protein CheW